MESWKREQKNPGAGTYAASCVLSSLWYNTNTTLARRPALSRLCYSWRVEKQVRNILYAPRKICDANDLHAPSASDADDGNMTTHLFLCPIVVEVLAGS